MTRPAVALATAARIPAGMADTAGLVAALAERGTIARVEVWDDPDVDWDAYAVVVPHSTWDWVPRRADFAGWLQARDRRGALVTPARLLAWSADKAYLSELAGHGVAVPAGVRLEGGGQADPALLRARLGDGPLVVKPAVGGGGHQVRRCADAWQAAELARLHLPDEPVLVQGFEPAVSADGEYSAVFVDGRLSHVVRKRPAAGDFRVHGRYGATREPVEPPAWVEGYGRRVLSLLSDVPLYARVDYLLPWPERPVLMELELLEPDLYLREAPGAFSRFADALARRALSVCPAESVRPG